MFRKILLITLMLAVVMTGCSPQATPTPASVAEVLTFTDGLGREVKLDSSAQKIVSLAPSNTEILFAIGAGSQVIGRDDFSDYPAEAASIQSVGGSMGNYSLEQIAALKPDLVLAGGINTPEQVSAIEALGITVFYLGNPLTLEEMYTNLEIVAQLTGRETEAATLIESLKARVKVVDETLAGNADKPIVFYEIDASDPNKPYTAGAGTFIDLLIARAGGQNFTTAAGITDAYPQVGLEQLIVTDPAFIILGDAMWGVTAESLLTRPGWEALSAIKNNKIFPFDDNLASRPGPRLVDGLEALAKLLHPDLFKYK